MSKRNSNLIVNGVPKYIRCYSNYGTKNETLDCVTVVFTKKRINGEWLHVGASITGVDFYQHGFFTERIDQPRYSHLGKKIEFSELSPELQNIIRDEYSYVWGLN